MRGHTYSYGEYSNKTRGWKAKRGGDGKAGKGDGTAVPTVGQAKFRKSWAQLIQQVWEVDPLSCPKCGKTMKIMAIVQELTAGPDPPFVIQKIWIGAMFFITALVI